ncbi:autotransporter domain-containing protein, partial [Sphingomonas echinoides]
PIDLTASVSGMHSNLTVSTVPAHGTTSIAGDVITYTPTTGYYGSDSFGYTATGPGGTSAAATVTLTVATPALAITQTSLPAGQQDVAYSVALTASGGTAPYTFAVTGGALPSGLALAANGTLAGTPTANGTFSVTITASDSSTGDGPSRVSQTFSLQIALPAPPVVHDTSVAVTQTVTNNQPASIDLSTLISGNVTDVTIATPPQHGTVVIQRSGASFTGVSIANPLQPGAVGLERSAAVAAPTVPLGATVAAPRFVAVYTPTPGYQGPDRFTFTAVGPGGSSTFATVDITVKGTPPVAANLVTTTDQNQPVTVDISSGAVGGPFTQAAIVSVSPANSATATLIADGTAAARTYRLQIQPSPRFSGTTVVTYTIGNTFGMSPAATITVTVKARPDPSADPVVRGLIDAQDTATRDFARAQIENFGRRNEQLHGGGGSTGNNPIGITLGSNDGGSFRRPGRFDGIAPETALKMEHANEVMGAEGLRVSSTGTLQPGGAPMGMPGAMGLRTPAGARNGIATGAATSARTAAAVGAVADETGDTGPRKIGSVAIWSGGAISIGTRDATTRRTKLSISSSGLSAGADVKLSDDLTVGAGGGVGEERTRVGTADAGHLTADTWIGAAYGSFRPTPGAFIDGVLGYGNLSFNTRRAALGGSLAVGHRNGSMLFGSLSAGIDQSTGRLSYSLYGRAEYLNAKLRAYAETGAGVYSLTFDPRTLESLTSVAGGRATLHLGAFAPRARFEWRHEFNQASPQLLDYADLGGPSQYSITTNDWLRDELQFEIGLGLNPGDGWTTGIDLGGRGGPGSRSMTLRLSATKKF